MGRQAGMPERKSAAKAEAARANARRPRLASRRGSQESEEQLRRCVEALRGGAPDAVALLRKIMDDKLYVLRDGLRVKVKVPTVTRLKAACELMDRTGLVRRSEQTLDVQVRQPKLVTIRRDFSPPPGWSETPPPRIDGAAPEPAEFVQPVEPDQALVRHETPSGPVIEPAVTASVEQPATAVEQSSEPQPESDEDELTPLERWSIRANRRGRGRVVVAR
jgi:hypothetical protein